MTVNEASPSPKGQLRSWGTHVFLVACIALVIVFFVWASMGKLDVVSTATGEVIPSSRVKSVQHLEGGIIREILIEEGEEVTKDQPLIELHPTTSISQVEELKIRLTSLAIKIASFEAEVAGAPELTVPESLKEENSLQAERARDLFLTRKARLSSQIDEQLQLITQREQEVLEVKGRITSNSESLELVDSQVEISNKLLKMSLTNRMRHLDLMKEGARLRGEISSDRTLVVRTQAAVRQARAHLEMIRTAFKEEARTELDKAQESYSELSQRLRKFEDSLKRTILRAPENGIVKTLHVSTRGGVIKPGQTVADIVPIGDKLIIEAKLQTGEIGYVRAGQTAMLRLASADAARFGEITGKVVHVSPDSLVTEQGAPYYKVSINPDQNTFSKNGLSYDLIPGLQLQCDIQTGERTVLEYMLSPYIQSMDQALRER